MKIKEYLLYSSVFAIFTEAFFFNFIIDWKLLYPIIIINFILLTRIRKITLNIYFGLFILFVIIHGLICYSIIAIPINYIISQLLGIVILSTYYYNFIPLYKKDEIIAVYLKMCFWVALIGYPMFFLNINLQDGRLQSIFKEPAHYAIVVIPACYYFLKIKEYKKFLVVFGTLLLSSSSLGYIGCALIFILPNLTVKRTKYLLGLIPVLVFTFYIIYNEFAFFKLRFDDTYKSLNAVNTGKFEEYTNLSTYVLLGNLYIAKQNVKDHPLGSGLGSFHHMHSEHYLKTMRVPPYIRTNHAESNNSFDACSLFTRIFSDFGYIGFFSIILVVFYTSKCYKSDELFFAQGLFIYILLKLFRDGHYFPPEFHFFIWMFYYQTKNFYENKLVDKP